MRDRDTSKVIEESARPLIFCDVCHCFYVTGSCTHAENRVTIDPRTMRKAAPRKRIDD